MFPVKSWKTNHPNIVLLITKYTTPLIIYHSSFCSIHDAYDFDIQIIIRTSTSKLSMHSQFPFNIMILFEFYLQNDQHSPCCGFAGCGWVNNDINTFTYDLYNTFIKVAHLTIDSLQFWRCKQPLLGTNWFDASGGTKLMAQWEVYTRSNHRSSHGWSP